MKFTRINDILVLTERGESLKECADVEIEIKNPGTGNYAILKRGPFLKEMGYFELVFDQSNSSYKISFPSKIINEDTVYTLDLFEKKDEERKNIATGRFQVTQNVTRAFFGLCEHELEKVWATFLYIAEKLGIDEAAIDTLITGYITE